MSSAVVSPIPKAHPTVRDPWLFRMSLITLASSFLLLFVVIPVWTVFHEALAKGIGAYLAAFQDSAGRSAIGLTLLVAAIAVPCNLIFGLCASWAIAKFQFPGKSLLVTDETASVRYCTFHVANSICQKERTISSDTFATTMSR